METDPVDVAESLGLVISRRDARAIGVGERRYSRLVAGGRWLSLGRGQAATTAALDERTRWRGEVVAAAGGHRRELVLSHGHAARAWNLPAPLGGWSALSFTASTGSTRYRPGLRIVVAPLDDAEVVEMGRVRVTSAPRTVLDCARTLPGPDALAIADRALRIGLVTHRALDAVAARQQGWPGAPQARRVLALATGRRETPLESWSAWSFDEQGLPQPQWQVVVLDLESVFVARPDALWEEGVVGEADGRAKYRLRALQRGGLDAESLAAVLDDERRREMELRRLRLTVVRWGPADVRRPDRARRLADHLSAEIRSADPSRFRGKIVMA